MPTTAKPLFSTLRNGLMAGALVLALAGCGSSKWGFPYRPDVQQGNWITSEEVAQLQPGMTREQVRFILGTPTLQDVFRTDRWDYPYYNKPGYGKEQERKFTVWFEGDSLTRWEGDEQPDRQPFQKADTGMGKDADFASAQPASDTPDDADDEAAHRKMPIFNSEQSRPADPGAHQAGRETAEPLR